MNICLKSYILKYIKQNRKAGLLICFIISVFLMIGSLFIGASDISARDILLFLCGSSKESSVTNVIVYARLPRIISSYLCGMALALSGMLLQAALNNPLASPGIIGVNSGAGFFVVLASVIFPSVFSVRFEAAFIGAMLTALLVFAIAKRTRGSRTTIILSGIAVSSLMSAATDAIITIKPEAVIDRTAFSIGGFSSVSMDPVKYAAPCIIVGIIGAFFLSSRLNVLLLGDEVASSLGLNVSLCRFSAMGFAALLAASAVCIGGLISFVGLIVPHIVRNIVGTDYKWLEPFTVLIGGCFLLLCDTLSRVIFSPYELPVGIILAFLGAPFFLYLLFSKKRRLKN